MQETSQICKLKVLSMVVLLHGSLGLCGSKATNVCKWVLGKAAVLSERVDQATELLNQDQLSKLGSKVADELNSIDLILKSQPKKPSVLFSALDKQFKLLKNKGAFGAWEPWFQSLLSKIDNPFALGSELRTWDDNEVSAVFSDYTHFMTCFLNSKSAEELSVQLNNWIKSPTHALLAYRSLTEVSSPIANEALSILHKSNKFYSDVIAFDSSDDHSHLRFITYAWEQETWSKSLRHYYKLARFTDEEWFALADEVAMALIKKATLIPNKEIVESIVVPTKKIPRSWGRFRTDAMSITKLNVNERISEVAHRGFEVSPSEIDSQLQELTEITNQKSAIHNHVVFELPVDYKYFKEFRDWYKYLNDYLFFKGLAEGITSSTFTTLPIFPEDVEPKVAALSMLQNKMGFRSEVLPDKLSEVGYRNAKFHGVGLRGGSLYGPQTDRRFVKIGFELRDSTRRLIQLKRYMVGTAIQFSRRAWEAMRQYPDLELPRLGRITKDQLNKLEYLVEKEEAQKMIEANPQVMIPFTHFEKMSFFNFSEGMLLKPTEEEQFQFIVSRLEFEKELKNIAQIINEFERKKDPIEPEVLAQLLDMAVANWANASRIVDFYRGVLPPEPQD